MENSILGNPSTSSGPGPSTPSTSSGQVPQSKSGQGPSASVGAKKEIRFSIIGLILGLVVIGYVIFALNFLSHELGLMGSKSLISQPNFVKFKLQEAKGM